MCATDVRKVVVVSCFLSRFRVWGNGDWAVAGSASCEREKSVWYRGVAERCICSCRLKRRLMSRCQSFVMLSVSVGTEAALFGWKCRYVFAVLCRL
jgi:hypothetical protein